MSFRNWKPPLTSMRAKNAWLWKNRAMWEYVPSNVLADRWSGACQALVDKALADRLYRPTTPRWDIWYFLRRKIKALKDFERVTRQRRRAKRVTQKEAQKTIGG